MSNNNNNNNNASGGLGIGGALLILFIALKLTGVINWSWWWVTSPIWIPLALILLIVFGGALIVMLFKK